MTLSPKRLVGIGLFFIVLFGTAWLLGESSSYGRSQSSAIATTGVDEKELEIVYRGFSEAMTAAPRNSSAREVSLRERYARRAYPGAPPMIPHPTDADSTIGAGCLDCHESGGYVKAYGTYAPITPHPTFENCHQCHVPAIGQTAFQQIDWPKVAPPELGQRALESSPPVIPHGEQLREDCTACHAGPAAAPEIRTTHPHRTNCMQCHAWQLPADTFQKPETTP